MIEELIIGTDFSGLGSVEEAVKRLNVKHRIAFACEKDKYATASYMANHHCENFYDDITKRNQALTPASDLYVFGFPCQAFSMAGNRKGFEDTRGTLFFNSLDYIAQKRPRIFIAENVKGLFSHDKVKGTKSQYGRTFGVIRDALAITINGQHNLYKYDDSVNYHVHFQILNTKHYGIPQNRERIFIVGFRDEADSIGFKYPKKITLEKRLKDVLEPRVDEKYYLSEKMLNYLLGRKDNFNNGNINFKGSNDIASTLQASPSLDISDNIIDEEKYNKRNRITDDTDDTDDIAPTILSNQAKQSTDSVYIAESSSDVIIVNDNGQIKQMDIFNCLDANYHKGIDNHAQRSMILETEEPQVLTEARTDYGKKIRKDYDKGIIKEKRRNFKEMIPRNDGNAICITSSQKDNLLIEPEVKECKDFAFRGRENENGKIEQEAEFRKDDCTNTITSVQKDNLVFEEDSIVFDKDNTQKGYSESRNFDSINISNPNSKTRRGRVGNEIANTLDTACNQAVLLPLFGTQDNSQGNRVYDSNGLAITQTSSSGGNKGLYFIGKRIRRLTPRECFRLMGYSDEFFEKCAFVNSDTQLYRQAGNSIVVDTIMHLLIQIFKAIKIPYTYERP